MSRIPRGATLLQWGRQPEAPRPDLWEINPHALSSIISDKRKFARAGLPHVVEWTENISQAQAWASERGTKVVCRTVLNGHSGEGIVIARNAEQVVEAPLYSRYFKKVREFRVYMSAAVLGPDEVRIECQHLSSKRNPGTIEDRDDLLIRSGTNGWVYQVEDTQGACAHLMRHCWEFMHGLCNSSEWTNYGWLLALDVAQAEDGTCKILEANLAPGLNEGTAQCIVDGVTHLDTLFRDYEADCQTVPSMIWPVEEDSI